MSNEQKTTTRIRKKALQSCVNFSEKEFSEIMTDTQLSGHSIPFLLKTAYFQSRRVRILMSKEDQMQWYKELRHWGNNLHQLAIRVNSGLMSGWTEDVYLIRQSITRIEELVVRVYGNRHV